MEEIRPSSFVYHSNHILKCNDFLNDSSRLIMAEGKNSWLGKGMYFWDSKSNAEFWRARKEKECKDKKVCIIKGMIYTDNDLDLTDSDVANNVLELWEEYLGSIGKENSKEKSLGHILDILFDFFNLNDIYNIVKVHGRYNAPVFGIFGYVYYKHLPMPTYDTKCIYNVKKSEAFVKDSFNCL